MGWGGGGAVGRFQSKHRKHLYFVRWPLRFCCFAFLLSRIEKRFPTPSFHSCWWLQISNEARWDGLKVKSVDLIERAFGREWTRQLAHGFKWNCIKACPATLSTGSQCELCWKIYFGELGLSIQREKTDWCGDIHQAVSWWWLCKWGFRVHGLKQAILKKKVCRGMAEPGAECCCVFATSSAQLLERQTPSSCISWTSLIFMPSSLTSHVERLNRKPYNGEGPVPITRLT